MVSPNLLKIHLKTFGKNGIKGKVFLDVGLAVVFSLAARRMGARVISFDYDPDLWPVPKI